MTIDLALPLGAEHDRPRLTALPSRTRKTTCLPSRVATASRGTQHDGRRLGASPGSGSLFSGSRNVTLALISGFRSLSLSRIVTFTITVALVRSAVGITWRSTAL